MAPEMATVMDSLTDLERVAVMDPLTALEMAAEMDPEKSSPFPSSGMTSRPLWRPSPRAC